MLKKILYCNSFMFFSMLFNLEQRAQRAELTLINHK